jgi:protein tyrosine phosphatase (PTP) superfamily phosphohydrolase (DUF442 family)
MHIGTFRILLLALMASCLLRLQAIEPSSAALTNAASFVRIEVPGIHNAFKVTEKIYSGSQPEGDIAFAALARLGVKTIISVDGSKPDMEAARSHGLRYIHLPFGYEGVPTNRVAEFVRAVEASSPGAVFVHCHRGQLRGPTAVAIICEATENWTANQAQAWMRAAGTSSDYAGLYRSAGIFKKPTPEQLAAVKDLPEVAKSSSLVEAMVAIDEHFSRLRLSQEEGWKMPRDHADITPEHEAMMLWVQLRELARTAGEAKHPADFHTKLGDAEKAAESLRQSLRRAVAPSAIDECFAKVGTACSACHKRYRNN